MLFLFVQRRGGVLGVGGSERKIEGSINATLKRGFLGNKVAKLIKVSKVLFLWIKTLTNQSYSYIQVSYSSANGEATIRASKLVHQQCSNFVWSVSAHVSEHSKSKCFQWKPKLRFYVKTNMAVWNWQSHHTQAYVDRNGWDNVCDHHWPQYKNL